MYQLAISVFILRIFKPQKSDKWHLSLSHLIDFKELPLRYTPTNLFQATQPKSQHHNLPHSAVTWTHNHPKVTTPKLECDGGNFASESIASNETYILWRVRLGMLFQSCTGNVDFSVTTERSHNVKSDCINKREFYCGCNTPPLWTPPDPTSPELTVLCSVGGQLTAIAVETLQELSCKLGKC